MNNSVKIAIIVGAIVLALLIIVPLIWGGFSGNWGYGGPAGMMGGYGFGGLMIIPMIVVWGLIIWGIVALIRGVTSPNNTGHSNNMDSPIEVLKKRYARGEINKEYFETKKKDLL